MIHHDILIVGSGVMGVALADSLNPKDFSIGIVESNSHHASFSKRHLSINKKSLSFLKTRCLGKNISECISYEKIKVWEQEGSGYIEFDANEARLNPLGHIVSEGNIQKNLLESLEKKEISFYWDNKLEEINKNDEKLPAKQVIMN